jgi:hypothetical protein
MEEIVPVVLSQVSIFLALFPFKTEFPIGKVVGGEGVLFLETKKAIEYKNRTLYT